MCFHHLSITSSAFYCSFPPLFFLCLFFGIFFPCSFHSVIPPPTLSQVKRSLPCFSSNWQMRCMSWLCCCFIRKQLFTLSLPPPSCFFSLSFFLSIPHYLAPALPCILLSISHHAFLHISPCLCRAHWCKLANSTAGVINLHKRKRQSACLLLRLPSKDDKKEKQNKTSSSKTVNKAIFLKTSGEGVKSAVMTSSHQIGVVGFLQTMMLQQRIEKGLGVISQTYSQNHRLHLDFFSPSQLDANETEGRKYRIRPDFKEDPLFKRLTDHNHTAVHIPTDIYDGCEYTYTHTHKPKVVTMDTTDTPTHYDMLFTDCASSKLAHS